MFFIRLVALILMGSSVMAATKTAERDLTQLRSIGLAGGDSIYIFTSARCPHCADFHKDILPEIIKKYAKTGRAKVFFVDDASDSEAINASMLARCLPIDKSEDFLTQVFKHQSDWLRQSNSRDKLMKYAVTAGLTKQEAQNCLANFELRTAMQDQWMNLSKLYNVLYLPTVVVRRGNSVKTYTGANKAAVLNGMEYDFQ